MPWLWLALKKLRSDWFSYEATERDFVAIGRPAVPKLVEILDERTDVHPNRWNIQHARLMAINAIEKIGDPRAVPALIRALGDVDSFIVYRAKEALRHFDTPKAIAALEKLERQREKDWQKQIYYVQGFRPHEDRWWMHVISVSPYEATGPDSEHWIFWLLGREPRELILDNDMKVYEDDGIVGLSEITPKGIYMEAVINELRIESIPPELTAGCFLAVMHKGVPCAFQVEVRLHFADWVYFPDSGASFLKSFQQGLESRVPLDEFEEREEKRVQYVKSPPEPGQDMPVSVQFGDHWYLGVLSLQERLEEESDSEEAAFRAELHFTETVPDLPPGTPLTRTVIWHEWLSDRSVTREVATVLSATRLSDGA